MPWLKGLEGRDRSHSVDPFRLGLHGSTVGRFGGGPSGGRSGRFATAHRNPPFIPPFVSHLYKSVLFGNLGQLINVIVVTRSSPEIRGRIGRSGRGSFTRKPLAPQLRCNRTPGQTTPTLYPSHGMYRYAGIPRRCGDPEAVTTPTGEPRKLFNPFANKGANNHRGERRSREGTTPRPPLSRGLAMNIHSPARITMH